MKFELEPDNRNCPDKVLLDDLKAVAHRLGKTSISKEVYDERGRFCSATIRNRFGSWTHALALSGLTVKKRVNIPCEELLADLKRVAGLLSTKSLSTSDYAPHGKFCHDVYRKRFGSWAKALSAVGLQPSPNWRDKATDEELLDNMALVWEHVGRQPMQKDFKPPVSRFSDTVYTRRFGSWRKALETFVASANSGEVATKQIEPSEQHEPAALPQQEQPRTPRNPSWRLRFLVMRRDDFKCRICGRSPATHPGTTLEADHIKAWTTGGETTMENLQTLCQQCNGGKSNLSMKTVPER